MQAIRTAIRFGIAAAVFMGASVAAETRAQTAPLPAAAVPVEDKGAKKGEKGRPPVVRVPAESTTPQEASRRAADPKDPSGALIIEPAKKP